MKLLGVQFEFRPFAIAKTSDGIFRLLDGNTEQDIPKTLLFLLYSTSIELGLKAAILSKDNSQGKQKYLALEIGHDLEKTYEDFLVVFQGQEILDQNDLKAVRKINPYFRKKGLEFFSSDSGIIIELMKGMRNLPSLSDIEEVAQKINIFISDKNLFIENSYRKE